MWYLRRTTNLCQLNTRSQRGAAFMVMLVIMVIGGAALLVSSLGKAALQNDRDQKTADALAQAKEALIGYAVKVEVSSTDVACAATSNCPRPGDLPCPDTDNDGDAEGSCGNADGSTGQSSRLGRLPWKTLGLPDLRDGSGERLWYAVSNNFKNNTRTICNNSNLAGCLNSDTTGTITVFGADGTVTNTANSVTGAVAVVFAPGPALDRQDNVTQNRGCTVNVDCDVNDKCTTSPPTNTPKCNPVNYLDVATVGGNTRDNKSFTDGLTTDGFIQGRILDGNGRIILNDHLLVISQDNIILPVQKRVAAEVKNCLVEYAATPQNNDYYPWAATRTFVVGTATYPDTNDLKFGGIPDQPFDDTRNESCDETDDCDVGDPSEGMTDVWGASCTMNNSNWWANWKEVVFYGLAQSLRPHDLDHNHTCPASTCIAVNPPSATDDKPFVVIVAGKKLTSLGQVRTSDANKSSLNNYLEGSNTAGTTPYQQSPTSTTFNDIVVFP
ncbi:MAG: hypothetical protein KJ795_14990 [Gammaproteobacteria bacterium]|nr:hypothetical protein [Gammaproteobacteria bacterium]MBU1777351.1 hypothetical protein [Gammaproteobacteria bacterium]MBU1968482.1 hypothetical protein [Gammaproteobacteria bacterium]